MSRAKRRNQNVRVTRLSIIGICPLYVVFVSFFVPFLYPVIIYCVPAPQRYYTVPRSKMSPKSAFLFEEYLKLAEHVSRHPCLFDQHHPAFDDQQTKEDLWTYISSVFAISTTDCKKHWNDMMTMYNKSRSMAKTETVIKNSEWTLVNALSFLDLETFNVTDSATTLDGAVLTAADTTTPNEYEFIITKNEEWDGAMRELMKLDDDQLFEVLYETVRQFFPDLKKMARAELLQVYGDSTESVPEFWAETAVSSSTYTDTDHDYFIEDFIRMNDERNRIVRELMAIEDDSLYATIFDCIKQFSPDLRTRTKVKILCVVRELLEIQTKFININK